MEVVVKPTNACNGACSYCAASAVTKGGKFLRAEALGRLFVAFRPWLEADPTRNIRFVWHGGEPLLAGPEFYEAVVHRQKDVFGSDLYRVRNAMQSNLTLITRHWIPVLEKLLPERSIGSSFDLVPGVRSLAGGRSAIPLWLKSVQLLQRSDFQVGVVYVVHRKSLPLANELYSFLKNALRTTKVRVNPLYPAGRAAEAESEELWITDIEYGEFLLELLERWHKDGCVPYLNPLGEWHELWTGSGQGICCDSGGRCHETHLSVAADGVVTGCGRAADTNEMVLGNLFAEDLQAILTREHRTGLARRSEILQQDHCGSCAWWPACRGGCPVIAWHYTGSRMAPTYYCRSRKMIYRRFEELFGPPVWARQPSDACRAVNPMKGQDGRI